MRSDTIVRQAAQAALASEHPVRVVDDGELVGIVDDDAILRVVVAEEDARLMAATLAPERPPEQERPDGRPAGSRSRSRGGRGRWSSSVAGSWSWAFTKGTDTLEIPVREHTDVQQRLTDFRDAVLASRDTNPIIQLTYDLGAWFTDVVELGAADDLDPRPAPPGPADRLARRGRDRDLDRAGRRGLADRRPRRGVVPLLRPLRLLVGLDGPAHRHLRRGGGRRADRTPARGVAGHHPPAVGRRHDQHRPRHPPDDADVCLPAADRAVLRHRRLGGRRVHLRLRAPAPDPDRGLRHPQRLDHDDRGDERRRPDGVPAAAQGAAADGPQDDRRRAQPDDHGRAVHGDPRGVRRRAGPRSAGPQRAGAP